VVPNQAAFVVLNDVDILTRGQPTNKRVVDTHAAMLESAIGFVSGLVSIGNCLFMGAAPVPEHR